MTLTAKQQTAIAKAPAAQKQQLRNLYHRQQLDNSKPQRMLRRPPGLARTTSRPARGAPRPTPKRQPNRTTAPRTAVPKSVPQPKNCLDPLCSAPVPTPMSEGKALPHTGMVRSNFSTETSNKELIVLQNPGNAGTVGIRIRLTASGSYSSHALFTIPTLSLASGEGGPSAARAMKLGVSLVNCSNLMKKGGRVIYLNSSQRLPGRVPSADQTGTRKEFTDILEAIETSPYSKVVTGDQLSVPHQLIAHPVDQATYNMFNPFWGTLSYSDFYDQVFSPPMDALPDQILRGMTTIAYIVEQTSEVQDYTLTIRASFYTRWPLTSVPGQSMTNIPTAPAVKINAVRDFAEKHANALHPMATAFESTADGDAAVVKFDVGAQ